MGFKSRRTSLVGALLPEGSPEGADLGGLMRKAWLCLGLVFVALGVDVWLGDTISSEGQKTIYTAGCVQGEWSDGKCSGSLAAGARFRFVALPEQKEVDFWVVGDRGPRGRLSPCVIQDGRNWWCAESADASKSITLALADGKPRAEEGGHTRPCHAISKGRWLLLKLLG
jgi:hypothetical protein